MSSDLIFFTGFEGCTSSVELMQSFSACYNVQLDSPGLRISDGFLGGKCMRQGAANSRAVIALPINLRQVHFGFHIYQDEISTSSFTSIYFQDGASLQLSFRDYEKIRLNFFNSNNISIFIIDVDALIVQHMWFHVEGFINVDTQSIIIKINGITVINESTISALSSTNLNNFNFHSISGHLTRRRYVYIDNIWIHKSKSLGQAVSFFSKPIADGHYVPNSGFFHTNDGSSEGWAKLQAMDGDTNYIYSSVANAKFTCKQEEIPIGYNPVAYSIQSVYRHNTGGNLLYVRDLKRYNALGIDFSGEIRAVPDTYTHSHLYRTNYDEAPDGTELTRDKINDMEIGSKLVELEE